jgi:Putative amidase domain
MQMPFYNRIAAVNYARTWTRTGAEVFNPVWGSREPNSDCTNFVSQALCAGGWEMVKGVNKFDTRDHRIWWAERFGSVGTGRSFTWSGAQPFYDFLQASGRAYWVTTPSQLSIGDVVQLRDAGEGGGVISHTTIVTKAAPPFSGNDIYLSYHSADHLDTSYNDMKARAGLSHAPIFWKLRDYYPTADLTAASIW